jgi:UDP-glucuronate decarboxylase
MATISRVIHEDAVWVAEKLGDKMKAFEGATVLITGANGFLGSFMLDVLADWNLTTDKPCDIIAMDNNQVGLMERTAHLVNAPGVELDAWDLTRGLDWEGPLDYVVHCAGIASPVFYREHPLETIDVNTSGTRTLLNLGSKQTIKAMLHLSTSEIYGDPTPDAIPTPETYRGLVSCTGPRACYDESKRLSETLCQIYHQQFGVPVKIGRPFNVYGPGQRIDDQRLVPDLMCSLLDGTPITLLSNGNATRSFCYLRDAAWAMFLILLDGEPGEAYNLGNDHEEVTMLQAARLASDLDSTGDVYVQFANSEDPHYLTDNPQRRCPDLTKIAKLGYEPTVDLAEGLERTYASYKESM